MIRGIEIVEGFLVVKHPRAVPDAFWGRLRHLAEKAGLADEYQADRQASRTAPGEPWEREERLFRSWTLRVHGEPDAVSAPRFVIVESPYAGDVERNLRYLRACMADCFARGEIPFASHALYTQPGVLRDEVPEEREKGINAGFRVAEALAARGAIRACYMDLGWSRGMDAGCVHAATIEQPVESRTLPGWEA